MARDALQESLPEPHPPSVTKHWHFDPPNMAGWMVCAWAVRRANRNKYPDNTLICCLHILHSPGGTPVFTQLSRCLEVLGPTEKNIEDANIHQIWVHVSQYPGTLVNPKQLVNWCSPPKKWNLHQGSDKGGGVVQRILIGTRHKA